MKNEEERLQELLERLEADEPVSDLLAEAAPEDAALLQLAAGLRELGAVERDSAVVAAQREQLLQEVQAPRVEPAPQRQPFGFNGTRSQTSSNAPFLMFVPFFQRAAAWLRARPLVGVGGAFAAVLILLVVTASLDRSAGGETVATERLAPPAGEAPAVSEAPSRYEGRPSGAGAVTEAGAEAPHQSNYLPLVGSPLVDKPGEAAVARAVGLVEVQNEAGEWTAVDRPHHLGAGQRVRTGALSHATLAFYDGSTARLGPNSELSIDQLHANPVGPRRVILTQWRGESEHEVAEVQAEDRTYRVDTPNGSGRATGTAFQVRVLPGVQSFFVVLHGSINVTNLDVTVAVVAGQLVIVNADQPPEDPIFRITGEGEVTAMGDTWTVGGQAFAVGENTVVVGDVAIGDHVFVEGHLADNGTAVADRIVLIGPSPGDTFALSGEVTAIGATSWTVAGQTIAVDDETEIEPDLAVGDVVRVEGRVLEGGELMATHIYLLDESQPFTFTGIVETMGADAWNISGVTVEVNAETAVDPGIEMGDLVVATGYIEDGSWVATSITREPDQENSFSFTGVVDSVDPWSVAGITFETREWTVIDEGIEVGDSVRVTGHILEDGTWVALSILTLDEDGLIITFVGTVDSVSPWIVNGLSLVVDESSLVDPDIEVGDLVLVRARRLPEGEWQALLIARLDDDDSFVGCFTITTSVVGWADGELVLDGWPNVALGADVDLGELIELDDAVTLGEGESISDVLDDSVVTIHICVLPDGEVVVINIIIIVILGEEPPPPPDEDEGESGKVTICHKPGKNGHTITIARPALQAHLGHGDYVGVCR